MRNKKRIIWIGVAVFLATWIGLVYLTPTIERQTIDGQYYEMKIADRNTSYLNESFSIKISGNSVLVHKNGEKFEGTIDKEAKSITFGGERYSYVSNLDIFTIASREKMQNLELEQIIFVKEGSTKYNNLKSQEN